MTSWTIAILALLPAFAIPAYVGLTAGIRQRFVAFQLATIVAILLLSLLTFALNQPSFIDLALALAVLTVPGTLFAALFLERWL